MPEPAINVANVVSVEEWMEQQHSSPSNVEECSKQQYIRARTVEELGNWGDPGSGLGNTSSVVCLDHGWSKPRMAVTLYHCTYGKRRNL